MKILVTGASGFIGQRLVKRLSESSSVVCLSRAKLAAEAEVVKGAFDRFEDLRKLDEFRFDAVVHLAAVTGGCSEEDGLAVNVLGTRRLYRYMLDRGCRQFITASSIAAVGSLHEDFYPVELPMPDQHPCLALDAYGFSKSLVEELALYFHRNYPDAGFVNLRLGGVVPDESWEPEVFAPDAKITVPFVRLARVYVSDVVAGIANIINKPAVSGVRTYNLVGPDSSCLLPTVEILRRILGDKAGGYDLSYYDRPGNENKPVYSMDKMKNELGFEPVKMTRNQAD